MYFYLQEEEREPIWISDGNYFPSRKKTVRPSTLIGEGMNSDNCLSLKGRRGTI